MCYSMPFFTPFSKKTWLKAALLLALLSPATALAADTVESETNSFMSSNNYNKEIKPILRQKCFDCHTTFTRYPWYYKVPGVKQLIDKDIYDARRDLDLTDGIRMSDLHSLQMVIEDNSMPPKRYTLVHQNSRLTPDEKEKLLSWIKKSAETASGAILSEDNKLEPISPLQAPANLDARKIELGRKLFHDRRLSNDNTISCASCHNLEKGGTDQLARSVGVHGSVGDINTPTVFNSSLNFKQFWDGHADTLAEQISGPIHNPKEMDAAWDDIIEKLKKDSGYKADFAKIYGSMTEANAVDALVEFENSLVTINSRFDKFLMGEANALSEDEKEGYRLFKNYGCTSCHQGANIGGNLFEKFGVMGDYFADRGNITTVDYGRFNVTKKMEDKFRFKIPSLRNVRLTPPYFHDGHAKTLNEAVVIMAKYQLGKKIPAHEVEKIILFLESLTGEYQGELLWTSGK